MLKHIIFIGILFVSGYLYLTERTITHGPGVVAPNAPTQEPAFAIKNPKHKDFTIRILSKFDMEARVLSKARYSDKLANIAPMDVVVGWGPMSDERNLNEVLIKQTDRYFNWQMTNPPIPLHKMVEHTANIHLAPSTPQIKKKIWEIREGHIVSMKGYLIEVSSGDGWSLKSSTRRNDYGKEASELLWIEEIQLRP
ncbi:MAG: hypothetical protein R3281_15930 [Balneolaceae bacterium]|nr:hypothetical protein [Balneolaceae bacterium]